MIYLRSFQFPDDEREFDYLLTIQRKCYTTYYPFSVIGKKFQEPVTMAPITIFYGGNGSGKTTALNIIAETLKAERDTLYNRSNFYPDYLKLCQETMSYEVMEDCRIITSDDVFDFMLNMRALNNGIDHKREELFDEYLDNKYAQYEFHSLSDYDHLKKRNQAQGNTQSMYVKKNLMNNTPGKSNGESGYMYFTEKIKENGLYLLDEPENSLSPARQLEMVRYIEDSVRFFGCQFIIATHSPFLLALNEAKIYDLDQTPAQIAAWTDLENVRLYESFFRERAVEFKKY